MSNNHPPAARCAFTVVEVLVVVGILVVLAGMLIPAISKVVAMGKQTRCASNMRQLNVAILAYALDHDDMYPAAPGIGDSDASWLAYWMLPTNGGAGQIDYSHGVLWPYLDRNGASSNGTPLATSARYRIFNCPADDEDLRLTAAGGIVLLPRNFTYSFNMELRQRPVGGTVVWRYGVHVSEVAMPSRKIVVVEEQWPNDGFAVLGLVDETSGNFNTDNPIWSGPGDLISARHNGLGNQGFADGHVEAIDPRSIGFSVYNLQTHTISPPTNTSSLAAARATDLFYSH